MYIKNSIIIILLLITTFGYSQEAQIDNNFDTCYKQASNSSEQLKCIEEYSLAWQQEIERLDALLLNILPKKMRKEINKSKKRWFKFYKEEAKMLDVYNQFTTDKVTYNLIINHLKAEMYKKRATQLMLYYSILKM